MPEHTTLFRQFVDDFRQTMSPPVFLFAAGLILLFVLYGAIFTSHAERTFASLQSGIVGNFGWLYILAANAFLIFVLVLALGPFGKIKLGGDQATPEFHGVTWFTMLLAAGMGIGLVFFGVAEPILHYTAPLEAEPGTVAAMREALMYSYFHWGLHPWAIYMAMALPLAYFHFRYQLPLAPRSLLYPLLGERIYGPIGHAIDVFATIGTLFGIGTSLGLGAMQINGGLNQIAGVPLDLGVQLVIIAGVTAIATISVVTGLHVGIRRLSQFNVGLAGLILAFVVIVGPTVFILESFSTGIGHYLQSLPLTSFRVGQTYLGEWQADWTLFFWSWWIAWTPFVGVFVARISRGRTIRQFVLAMLLVPSLAGFFWFAALGGTALFIEYAGTGGIAEAVAKDEALAFYAMLEHLPLSAIVSVVATVLIVIFFVTSSDSGSFVVVMITSGGHPKPPRTYRIFWCVSEGVVAAVLLVTGGLAALRTASLTPALPMVLLLLIACYGLWRALRVDASYKGKPPVEELTHPVQGPST